MVSFDCSPGISQPRCYLYSLKICNLVLVPTPLPFGQKPSLKKMYFREWGIYEIGRPSASDFHLNNKVPESWWGASHIQEAANLLLQWVSIFYKSVQDWHKTVTLNPDTALTQNMSIRVEQQLFQYERTQSEAIWFQNKNMCFFRVLLSKYSSQPITVWLEPSLHYNFRVLPYYYFEIIRPLNCECLTLHVNTVASSVLIMTIQTISTPKQERILSAGPVVYSTADTDTVHWLHSHIMPSLLSRYTH